ncbi:hypothetical protein D3C72_2326180 [compost metagenome]
MPRVKMNSITSTQPVTTGPRVISSNGLSSRNRHRVALYQRGDCPRKLWARAPARERDM